MASYVIGIGTRNEDGLYTSYTRLITKKQFKHTHSIELPEDTASIRRVWIYPQLVNHTVTLRVGNVVEFSGPSEALIAEGLCVWGIYMVNRSKKVSITIRAKD